MYNTHALADKTLSVIYIYNFNTLENFDNLSTNEVASSGQCSVEIQLCPSLISLTLIFYALCKVHVGDRIYKKIIINMMFS